MGNLRISARKSTWLPSSSSSNLTASQSLRKNRQSRGWCAWMPRFAHSGETSQFWDWNKNHENDKKKSYIKRRKTLLTPPCLNGLLQPLQNSWPHWAHLKCMHPPRARSYRNLQFGHSTTNSSTLTIYQKLTSQYKQKQTDAVAGKVARKSLHLILFVILFFPSSKLLTRDSIVLILPLKSRWRNKQLHHKNFIINVKYNFVIVTTSSHYVIIDYV